MNSPDHISESLETIFWVKKFKFLDADMGSGIKKFGSGINFPDPLEDATHFRYCTSPMKNCPLKLNFFMSFTRF